MKMDTSHEVSVWRYRRVKILEVLNEKLIPIGRVWEYPNLENAGTFSYANHSPEEQRGILFNAIKRNILGEPVVEFFPYEAEFKTKFKIASGCTKENKHILERFTPVLRHVVNVRIYLSRILTNTTCGVVARTVAEIIRDYMTITMPATVENIFKESDGSLIKLESNLQHFTSDMAVLSLTLKRIFDGRMVGGELITYLDRPEVHQMPANYCAVPVLFNQCIREAIKHYDAFLEEWLYTGQITTDRQHEFMIWDLSRSNILKASIFDGCDMGKPEIPFDKRFVFIPDLVPSVWKSNDKIEKMAHRAFNVRRLISVLTQDTQVPFNLEFHSIVNAENVAAQNLIVWNAFKATGTALLQKINSVINIQEFFKFLNDLIFDPCAMWMHHFAADLEDYRLAVLNTSDDPYQISNNDDTTGLNGIFNDYFFDRLRRIVNNKDNVPDVVEMRLYNQHLFSKLILNDLRLVDMLNCDYDLNDMIGDDNGHDENNPNGLPASGDGDAPSSENGGASSDVDCVQDNVELPFVEKVGIGFTDMLLFQFLVPPVVQEDYNRLFRLRLSLARAELLLQRKRTTDIQSMNQQEQIFISFVMSFLRRVSFDIFGYQAASHWDDFFSSIPKLKTVTQIAAAQGMMHRNINSQCGLYSGENNISAKLTDILVIVNDYALNELCFNDAADRFYEVYIEMRNIVCAPENNKLLNKMIYPIFHVSTVGGGVRAAAKVPLDPRKGLAPQPNLKSTVPMRRSISLMGLQSGAGRK